MKRAIYYKVWHWWHSDLRWWLDRQFNNGHWRMDYRPWWHPCCNGDMGGWRTDLCNWLERKWRAIDHAAERQAAADRWMAGEYDDADAVSTIERRLED